MLAALLVYSIHINVYTDNGECCWDTSLSLNTSYNNYTAVRGLGYNTHLYYTHHTLVTSTVIYREAGRAS